VPDWEVGHYYMTLNRTEMKDRVDEQVAADCDRLKMCPDAANCTFSVYLRQNAINSTQMSFLL